MKKHLLLLIVLCLVVGTRCSKDDHEAPGGSIAVTEVKLSRTTLPLKIGETSQLTATTLPENATEKTVTWSSNTPNIASVDKTGLITAIAEGSTIIIAEAGGKKAQCVVQVTIDQIVATEVKLDKVTLSLNIGETEQLVATVLPENATNKTVIWDSSNEGITTVNENGLVIAIAEGEATITAMVTDKVATCTITVIDSGKDITAKFDPEFARVLEERGYIPDATHITQEDVQDIEIIDVSGDASSGNRGTLISLKGIEYCMSLTDLNCEYNQLTLLNISNNKKLTRLNCGSNDLTSLYISNNTDLIELDCWNNHLTSLNLNNNGKLTNLYCSRNRLSTLDVYNNTELTSLAYAFNSLPSLDVSNYAKLKFLDCRGNGIISLDISNNTELKSLICNNNILNSLDISHNTKLMNLQCQYNQITSLDISNNTELTVLVCELNHLTSLDISNNTKLLLFDCNANPGTNGIFPVIAWFDNDAIPQNFTTGNWEYKWQVIAIDYQKVK